MVTQRDFWAEPLTTAYDVVLADPPWFYDRNSRGDGAADHYDLIDHKKMLELKFPHCKALFPLGDRAVARCCD